MRPSQIDINIRIFLPELKNDPRFDISNPSDYVDKNSIISCRYISTRVSRDISALFQSSSICILKESLQIRTIETEYIWNVLGWLEEVDYFEILLKSTLEFIRQIIQKKSVVSL